MYITNKQAIEQNERIKGDKKELGMDKDEPFNLGEDTESITPGRSPSNALDTFLSGYYIIEDILYRTSDGETKQYVTLLRREWPTRTENLINPPGLEDATPEKKAENIKENSPPPPEPSPTPAPTPEPTPPAEEPEFTINPELLKRRTGIGSWFELSAKLQWTADDISLVTETPKVKLTFKGPSDYEVDAAVMMENKTVPGPGGYGTVPYNIEFTVPKNTFKDKEGKYTIDITLTYKDQAIKETVNWEFYKWTPDKIYDQSAIRSGKLLYTWQTISGKEAGTFIGQYTLKGEATKDGNGPRNGKIEGTDINDVIKRTTAAGESEA
jgi:hypothetical protein